MALLVHGDDFCAVGPPESLARLQATLSSCYRVKTETLGPGPDDLRELGILNRVVQWHDSGVRLEADPRHVEIVVREYGAEGGRDAASAGDTEFFKKAQTPEELRELEETEEARRLSLQPDAAAQSQ